MGRMTNSHFDGNAARKIEYDVYKENVVLKQKRKFRTHGRITARVLAVVFLVFMMGFTIMYRYALLTEMNYDIEQLNRKYTEMKNDNSMLKVKIGEQTVLEKVGEVAGNKLGMTVPVNSQMVQVRVPGEDYTKVSEEYTDREPSTLEGVFAVLIDKVSRISKLLY